MIDKPLSKL